MPERRLEARPYVEMDPKGQRERCAGMKVARCLAVIAPETMFPRRGIMAIYDA